jgi:serine/threonine-protein kinase
VLWSAAGLDPATFTPAPLARPVPAVCDSAAAWTGPLPWNNGENVTVQAGASRGRLVHFTIVHSWGTSTAPVDSLAAEPSASLDWTQLVFSLLPLFASAYFAMRNLRLGRGDWRSATRVALFVFVMNELVAVFTTRLSEVGLAGAGWDLFTERAFGHSLMHAIAIWLAYVALEPYVRRLWPRILVSWTRLVSGRARDPLVGRDLLIGGMSGMVINGLTGVAGAVMDRIGLARVPTQIGTDYLESVTSLPLTICHMFYAGSVCLISTLEAMVMLVTVRLIFRRTWAAVVVAIVTLVSVGTVSLAPSVGLGYALVNTVIGVVPILILMRFGLFATAVTLFVGLVLGSAVATLDLSSWYADRALLPGVLLVGMLIYGAATALAGKPILGDPLRESPGR